MICSMRSRASQLTVALVLFTCFVSPVVEMFDQWDRTIQTGNDIEYALVVLALCVGLMYTFARFVSRFRLVESAMQLVFSSRANRRLPSGGSGSFFVVPIPLNSSALTLRI